MKYKNKKEFSIFVILALATASMMSIGIESPKHQQAVAQSSMDMMNMMMGGSNMTDGTTMMGGNNMSMPFNMGVLVMPTMCTTPGQLLGSMTGMMEGGNATNQTMMGMMQQQMMSEAGLGMENMTEGETQQVTNMAMNMAMNLTICLPVMDEKMMEGMVGSGQHNMSSMMGGMMMH
jgi:hypothetical protein